MKLRNKKTGGIVECKNIVFAQCNAFALDWESYTTDVNSLAELNEEWEDYKPAEPIINETDVRHILKLWASTNHIPHNSNEIEVCLIDRQKGTITQFYSDNLYIQFWVRAAHDAISGRCYTIDELCGEDEE